MPVPYSLLEKLARAIDLTEAERAAVRALPVRHQAMAAGWAITCEGERSSRCFLLTQGLTSASNATAKGRQTTAFHVPGDMPDLHGLHLGVQDATIRTLTDCVVAYMDHEPVRRLCAEQPRVAAELWRVTLVDGAIFREWVVSLGRRSEVARTAHLLCELLLRLSAIGQGAEEGCELPLTPVELGEALGLSMVQVDHALQALKRGGLAALGDDRLTIYDWHGLTNLADFRPDYLHLRDSKAAW